MALMFEPWVLECEDCGCQSDKEPLVFQVVETKRLCSSCAGARTVIGVDIPAERVCCPRDDGLPEGKTLSLKCRHCTQGMCDVCRARIMRHLEELSPPEDIRDKKSLSVTRELELPSRSQALKIYCMVGNNKVAIGDRSNGSLITMGLNSGEIKHIVSAGDGIYVTDCTTANRTDLMLSNLATGSISLCNSSGKPLAEIALPQQRAMKEVYLATDRDGQILAARHGESKIHVFHVLTEQHIKTIRIVDKTVMRGIQVSPSGAIIVQTDWAEFTVIDGSGQHRTITDGNWFQATCGIHPTQDLIYVMYSRSGGDPETIHVDEVTLRGEIKRMNILSFKIKGALSPPIITPDMQLLVLNGQSLFVYE